jgi:hypothetical protein
VFNNKSKPRVQSVTRDSTFLAFIFVTRCTSPRANLRLLSLNHRLHAVPRTCDAMFTMTQCRTRNKARSGCLLWAGSFKCDDRTDIIFLSQTKRKTIQKDKARCLKAVNNEAYLVTHSSEHVTFFISILALSVSSLSRLHIVSLLVIFLELGVFLISEKFCSMYLISTMGKNLVIILYWFAQT